MDAHIAVAGIGRSDFSVRSGRSTLTLTVQAARAALDDAGLTTADIDGIGTFGLNDTPMAVTVADALGVDDLPWAVDLYGGGNNVVGLIGLAAAAIRSGSASTVLVYRSLNGRSAQRLGDAAEAIANTSPEAQFNAPQGYVVPPQFMAMWARRHQHQYGSTCADLGRIAMTQRAHAAANPHAIARTPFTLDDYLDSRWINEPLRVFDCAFEVDGAVALLVTTLERARDLAAPPVRIGPMVSSHGHGGSWDQWPDPTEMFSHRVAPRLMKLAKAEISGIQDIDVACIYDCFSYTVMAVMEDFEFAEKGGIGDYFASGRASYGGDVVVNPHGGLLSEGYIHGLNTHYEAVLQLREQAGPRQVPDAEVALVTAGAGPFGGAAIYTRDR
jgi:acetyl-CoA acetyltransferase